MIGRPRLERFALVAEYEWVKKELLKGHKPIYHRMLERDGYSLVDDMQNDDIQIQHAANLEGLLVQSLPLWVGTHVKKNLFFQALYSWDELWNTVQAGWTIFGDPRRLSDDEWIKWISESTALLHSGYFAGCGRSILLWPKALLGDSIERGTALYDHGYRVVDWLGFLESTMPTWWLFAYVGGRGERLSPWLGWFKTSIAYRVIEGLKPFQDMVMRESKRRAPLDSDGIVSHCPPPDYDVRSQFRKGKYTLFDPRLRFPSYRRWIVSPTTYMPDPLTRQKLEAIQDIWRRTDPSTRVKGLDAEERAQEAREVIEELLKHPMYRQLQMAKFQMSEESRQRLDKISALVNECNQGKRPIADLLEWALIESQSEIAMSRLKEFDEALRYGKTHIQNKVLDKVYKQVKAWFDRRGSRMPKVEKDWRDKITEKRISKITR